MRKLERKILLLVPCDMLAIAKAGDQLIFRVRYWQS